MSILIFCCFHYSESKSIQLVCRNTPITLATITTERVTEAFQMETTSSSAGRTNCFFCLEKYVTIWRHHAKLLSWLFWVLSLLQKWEYRLLCAFNTEIRNKLHVNRKVQLLRQPIHINVICTHSCKHVDMHLEKATIFI